MKCDFEYCIYNRDFIYIVDEPTINFLGMCDDCIAISLEKEKERQLY